MAGVRSLFIISAAALAALLYEGQRQPTLDLDMVDTGRSLIVMRHEVTITDWRGCYAGGGCSFMPKSPDGVDENIFPVTGVSIMDAEEFAKWARKTTGRRLRLPTADEWQELSGLKTQKAPTIFTDPRLDWASDYGTERKLDPTLLPQGSFGANAQGVADLKGNVWEWTSTCVVERAGAHCPAYFAAGEHEAKVSIFIRDPQSGGCTGGIPPTHLGLRLVQDLDQVAED
jgi:formylglycine-generating enzyme required for sulfatase activity